jgi:hypothetical protein
VIAAAGLVFLYVSENLPIFEEGWAKRQKARHRFSPAFDSFSGVWRMTLASGVNRAALIAVFAVPVAWVLLYPPFTGLGRVAAQPVRPPVAADAERAVLKIDGDNARLAVAFPHVDHQRRLGGEGSCRGCHHVSLPRDHSTPCSRCHRDMERPTEIFDHAQHFAAVASRDALGGWIPENQTCSTCHEPGMAKGAGSAKGCMECHREDMAPSREPAGSLALAQASGYRVAMHETCMSCHEREAVKQERPGLAECSTCHEDLRRRELTGTGLAQIAEQTQPGHDGG